MPLRHADPEQLRALFDASLDALIGMDSQGRVIAWNREATRIFGWSTEEALGAKLSNLIVPLELREAHEAGLRRYLATGVESVLGRRVEIDALHRSGRKIDTELSILAIVIKGEEFFYASLRDITREKADRYNLERREVESRLLYEASIVTSQSESFETLVRRFLELICKAMDWPCGHAYVIDEAQDLAVPSGIWFPADAPMSSEAMSYKFRRGEGLPGRIWASGRPEHIEDIAGGVAFYRLPMMARHGIISAFGFPIHLKGRVSAVLEFFSPQKRQADALDNVLVKSLGTQLGQILQQHQQQEENRLLMREVVHRAKNLLSVTLSLFRQSVHDARSVEDLSKSFPPRLQALSQTLELTSSVADKVWLADIVKAAVSPLAPENRLEMTGRALLVQSDYVSPLSLVFHELATNATKYGAWSGVDGKVAIAWTYDDGVRATEIAWIETGGPPVSPSGRTGFGSSLLNRLVTAYGGDIQFIFDPRGLQVKLTFVLGALNINNV